MSRNKQHVASYIDRIKLAIPKQQTKPTVFFVLVPNLLYSVRG